MNAEGEVNGTLHPLLRRSLVLGTYTWMAPELLERPDFYTEKVSSVGDYSRTSMMQVDVYSYGICMYEVMARKMPFSEKGERRTF